MPTDETAKYKVVMNHEEQYSIWPLERENPLGWRDGGKNGTKEECLAYIEEVWTDMRPLSLRKAMEEAAKAAPLPPRAAPVDDLVDRLCAGKHPVEMVRDRFDEAFKEGYVHVRFTGTRGGTELGIRLDPSQTLQTADRLRIAGDLTLNFVRVRCFADVDRTSLSGDGWLERLTVPS
jgi:uncharacterized protein YbdZ (MbtH family)